MWIGVTARFSAFRESIKLTDEQISDGVTKSTGIVSTLNAAYHGHSDQTANGMWVGSWGKTTQARPPRDIDLFFTLPWADYHRVEAWQGNKQSQLLQEVKNVLQSEYSQTDMRGDGQVVMVQFNTILVEVLPCFELTDGRFYICDTHNGGSWTVANPRAEVAAIHDGDQNSSGNLRHLIRMLKIWKRYCNVPIKSYILETLATDFMAQSNYRDKSVFWYDWMLRDAFIFLADRAGGWVVVPDGNVVALGDDWKSKAESARNRAFLACDHEFNDRIPEAGDEWQKIFGTWILKHVA